jgi:hypothetical protein
VIKPGTSESVSATFASGPVGGPFTKKITVTTNDREHLSESLECSGKVQMAVRLSPLTVNFAQVDEYTTPMPMTVRINSADAGPLAPEVIGTSSPGLDAQLREIKAGEQYELVVSISPPLLPGRLRGWVKLKTGVTQTPETQIMVSGNIPSSWAELAAPATPPAAVGH